MYYEHGMCIKHKTPLIKTEEVMIGMEYQDCDGTSQITLAVGDEYRCSKCDVGAVFYSKELRSFTLVDKDKINKWKKKADYWLIDKQKS
tara:strand:- start:8223 stop:8489 length:267 start_codon:yes stop_codon:yes gene_type:complete